MAVKAQSVDFKRLGERVRAHRLAGGMTVQDVTRATGVARSVLFRVEAGRSCRTSSMLKLARWVGIDPDKLLVK